MRDFFESAFKLPMTRRRLIKRIAIAGAATWATGALPILTGCATLSSGSRRFSDFRAIAPSVSDALEVPDGYVVDTIIKWGDEFAPGMRFGYNCDFTAWFPFTGRDAAGPTNSEGLIWVNHEYVIPFFTSDWVQTQDANWNPRVSPYRELMEREKYEVGGSILHIKRSGNGPWQVVYGSPYSRRFTADSPPIPYDGPVAGTSYVPSNNAVLGTMANCSGAQTPWGTVLSCEENYQSPGLKRSMPFGLGWIKSLGANSEDVNYYVGEHGTNVDNQEVDDRWPFYGYVVEIDPVTGTAVKHTALGRIHHENVALRIGPGGHVICYMGDDAPRADGMFFKFVSRQKWNHGMTRAGGMKLLSEGQLYVAQWFPLANDATVDRGTGRWLPLNMRNPEALAFTTKWIETNIVPPSGGNLRQFHVPRAEDCEIVQNRDRDVLISLTSALGRPADAKAYGVVRLLREDSGDAHCSTFSWVDLLKGGQQTGFANPDNLAFSLPDEVWVVTDISSKVLNVAGEGFEWHGNNALFFVPLEGRHANTAFRFANAPVEAELTGPTFDHQQLTLFLSVQHPGEETPTKDGVPGDPTTYTSWWPEGNRTVGTGKPGKPKPSLVAIRRT